MSVTWLSTLGQLRQYLPRRVPRVKDKANFILIHYAYIVAWTLLGSVIMYGSGRIPYIDALFFASGAATQSGLNTIDVNKLGLYQQVAIMLIACVCNPIFINTSVVFIRLYWFEKRFQSVILGLRSNRRRTQTIARRKEGPVHDFEREIGLQEGVDLRRIQVMRSKRGHAYGGVIENVFAFSDGQDRTGNGIRPRRRSSVEGPDPSLCNRPASSQMVEQVQTTNHQERRFTPVDPPVDRLPQASREKSNVLVEAQLGHPARSTLRIPSPRDFDRGRLPERVNEGDQTFNEAPSRVSLESNISEKQPTKIPSTEVYVEAESLERHVTIDVSVPTHRTAGVSAYKRTQTAEPEPPAPASEQHLQPESRSGTFSSFVTRTGDDNADPIPYLSWSPTIGRNSNFVDLTEEQREELGGIEYRALKLLALILVCFFIGFHLLGMICLITWIHTSAYYRSVVQDVGITPTWWSFFTAASLFNDLGFTLTPNSMISFQQAVFPLIMGTYLIIIGNTGFPCMLRFVIWAVSKCVPKNSGVWEELRFLLDHPRRCFTLLFPSKANWILFWILVLLNGVDLMFFIVLDLNDPTVTTLPPGFQFLAGLFQAASTRTAGFAVVDLPELHPAVQVSYMVMMYISVFPIAMSIRQSNVYEERSLGVWASGTYQDKQSSYLSHHLRRQLSFDLWFVFLGFFLIAIIEGRRLEITNEYRFTLFSVLFEIVSAYGTVGLSQCFPGYNTSFSGQLRTLSKLVIIAMQIRGRHRGLPYVLDRAILLPSESLHQKENEDATRRARRLSNTSDGYSRTISASGREL